MIDAWIDDMPVYADGSVGLPQWRPPLAAPSHLACGYAIAAHRDGRCPDEHEARAQWGDR